MQLYFRDKASRDSTENLAINTSIIQTDPDTSGILLLLVKCLVTRDSSYPFILDDENTTRSTQREQANKAKPNDANIARKKPKADETRNVEHIWVLFYNISIIAPK